MSSSPSARWVTGTLVVSAWLATIAATAATPPASLTYTLAYAAAGDSRVHVSLAPDTPLAGPRSVDFRIGRSVFSRGALMAADMDDRIRERTGGAKSLRDALRFLVTWTREHRRAFETDELPDLIREAAGVDVRDIFARWSR